ncbi:MAG: LCP family protein [Candidatus Zipacnadales bacterium]
MVRITDVGSCSLAALLIALGIQKARPFVQTFHIGAGRSNIEPVMRLGRDKPPFSKHEKLNIIGVDKRLGGTGRSDTLIALFLNPRTARVALLSIPRKVRVPMLGHGCTTINHAYGGALLTKRTIESLLGIAIDYYVSLDGLGA